MQSLLIKNIARLVTMNSPKVITNAAVFCEAGKVKWLGAEKDLPQNLNATETVSAEGGVVMPGLIDCHTHLVHAGSRQHEFNQRSQGVDYLEIAKAGGGILSTVLSTRKATAEQLYQAANERLKNAMKLGTTTFEIKTGYGLELKTELKMVEVIGRLQKDFPGRVHGTFLGAHVVPREYKNNRKAYLRLLLEQMLPQVAETRVCSACDVFVEEGAFTFAEAKQICTFAKELGFEIRLHVDQFADGKGGALAAELGALDADHLDYVSAESIAAMAKANVVGVALPGESFFTGGKNYPPARKMIDAGVKVAIATDYNPGTNPNYNLWLAGTIAATQMQMSLDEVLQAITVNAAQALKINAGKIQVGETADLIILAAADEYYPLYNYGTSHVRQVILAGKCCK
jgi:imidazolonepropionase